MNNTSLFNNNTLPSSHYHESNAALKKKLFYYTFFATNSQPLKGFRTDQNPFRKFSPISRELLQRFCRKFKKRSKRFRTRFTSPNLFQLPCHVRNLLWFRKIPFFQCVAINSPFLTIEKRITYRFDFHSF